tara:strand:- start:437 stop:619 length:183 start_codon:yes stop_codon:yes gene_type:complete
VLINDEAQHSLWPAGQQAPAGCIEVGFTGGMQECSDDVDQQWKICDLFAKNRQRVCKNQG